jgi:hypothetical protein
MSTQRRITIKNNKLRLGNPTRGIKKKPEKTKIKKECIK